MTDHAQEARDLIEHAYSDDPAVLDGIKAVAHATLALAEQQRIANLIALSTPRTIPGGGTAPYMLYDPETRALREGIRQGLGL